MFFKLVLQTLYLILHIGLIFDKAIGSAAFIEVFAQLVSSCDRLECLAERTVNLLKALKRGLVV